MEGRGPRLRGHHVGGGGEVLGGVEARVYGEISGEILGGRVTSSDCSELWGRLVGVLLLGRGKLGYGSDAPR